MECCRSCMHHAPQAENEHMCNNEQSQAFGLSTQNEDYCVEYSEDVSAWNLTDESAE